MLKFGGREQGAALIGLRGQSEIGLRGQSDSFRLAATAIVKSWTSSISALTVNLAIKIGHLYWLKFGPTQLKNPPSKYQG